ncbi:MAG: DEAD/DEAH box helicase family protein [Betaproteobacteria bacterium]|nr:DEAD/DEAH box helicase family protein [Betaproteobacteria bacterium]
MKFQFDSEQEHQTRAVSAVVDIFSGQPYAPAQQNFVGGGSLMPTVPVAPNNSLELGGAKLLANLRAVQARHNEYSDSKIEEDGELRKIIKEFGDSENNGIVAGQKVEFPNFSVEMETGTGKTYVFLRTIRELAENYGFIKFLIVAPSIAVRENILHSLNASAGHFAALYKTPCNFLRYNSQKLNGVRAFAAADSPQIMVITLDSFRREETIMRRGDESLSGDMPLRIVQATRPILILDEPQNMASVLSVESLARLNPLFALRYSATHREPYNMAHRLSPAAAYRRGLVKKIQVGEVSAANSSAPFVRAEKITRDSNGVFRVKITVNAHDPLHGMVAKTKTLMPHSDLGGIARLPAYEDLYIDDINITEKAVRLSDGRTVHEGEEIGGDGGEVMRGQIMLAIREHFQRQKTLKKRGVKVLSLFFIDKVDNYLPEGGKIRRMFEECFDELKTGYPEWRGVPAREAHRGYFAKSKKGDSEQDVKAYDLIMRDKESLLTFAAAGDDEETRRKRQTAFIFSHSALREGWDNPNIMQICALRRGREGVRRRQEVGRGLRLAVNQKGERVRDEDANLLTVIAAESYAEYVRGYQEEIAEEYRAAIEEKAGKPLAELTAEEREKLAEIYGEGIIPPPPRKLEKKTARATRLIYGADGGVKINPEFRKLWKRIGQKTAYRVNIDNEKLIRNAVNRMRGENIASPEVRFQIGKIKVDGNDAFNAVSASGARKLIALKNRRPLPDVVSLILRMLRNGAPPLMLTRKTVSEIFAHTVNESAVQNPNGYAAAAARVIREEMEEFMADGVEYEKIENAFYEWEQHFMEEEHEITSSVIADMKESGKTPYTLISCDSGLEKEFAEGLRERGDIKMFVKLPRRFTVPTPVGDYNPDWAVLMADEDGGEHLYFVAETKGAVGQDGAVRWSGLRGTEGKKIKCAARHFGSKQFNQKGALDGVDYKVVKSHEDLRLD